MKTFRPARDERNLLVKSIDAITLEIRQRIGELEERGALESEKERRGQIL